jgi:hypothetical protein
MLYLLFILLIIIYRVRSELSKCNYRQKEGVKIMTTILIVVLLVLVLGGGGGYYAHGRYGATGVGGVLGLVLIVLLVLWFFGGLNVGRI